MEIDQSIPVATTGVCVLMWFGTFAQGCLAPRGRVASTCHLHGTPPHTPAHLPKKFCEDRTTLVFRGVLAPGLTQQPLPGSQGWCWGGCIICPPWARDLGSLVLRWGTCPHHLPKRADWCLDFDFLRGIYTRCLAAASPRFARAVNWVRDLGNRSPSTPQEIHFFQARLRQGAKQPSSPRFARAVHSQCLQAALMWFGTFCLHPHCSMGEWGMDLPSSGKVPPTLGQVLCESGADQTKHSGSYPWGVCSQGSWCDLAH